MSSVESIIASALSAHAVDRYQLAMALLETIREPLGAPKAKKSKASKGSAEPKKREPTSWNKGCAAVREAIKEVSGYKPPHVMAFAKVLKAADEAGWAEMEAADITEKYEAWLVDNSDVGSRSSGGSKAPKAKEPKAEPSEEEKAAKRKLAAEKRKATMAAKKASAAAEAAPSAPKAEKESKKAAAAEAAPSAPKAEKESKKAAAAAEAAAKAAAKAATEEESEDLEEDVEIEIPSWHHDFGDGLKTYGRYEKDGEVYIYESDGTTYLGQLIKGKLNPKKADPLA